MKFSNDASKPNFFPIMEHRAFLLPLLVLSYITLLLLLQSSNPFTINQDPLLQANNSTYIEQVPDKNTTTSSSKSAIIVHKDEHIQTSDHSTEEVCDLFVGKWVKEPRGSIYTNVTCTTIPDTRNCGKYGKDQGYVYWKWKPDGCELPRFDPGLFLSIVRGKKLAFIGDSLARNQMESLLCLLSQAETPHDIYKDANDKFRTWYFPSHDFTLMVKWTEFLAESEEIIVNGVASNTFNITLDRMSRKWAEILPELQYAVINCGNWFSRTAYIYKGGKLLGCVHCGREENVTQLSVPFALRSVFGAALEFVNKCEDCDGLLAVVRTYSPSHFEHGEWVTGGYCNRTRPLKEVVGFGGVTWGVREIQLEEFERVRGIGEEKRRRRKRFEVLDVTNAIVLRADGHPGLFLDRRWMKGFSDCLHWCLPGPIDLWNELLLAVMERNLVLN